MYSDHLENFEKVTKAERTSLLIYQVEFIHYHLDLIDTFLELPLSACHIIQLRYM